MPSTGGGNGLGELLDDLAAEQRALQEELAEIDADSWLRPTPARGWDVRDTVAHLADTDDMAVRVGVSRAADAGELVAAAELAAVHRVHAELLRLAQRGIVNANQARIDPAPRHGEIANRVSTYREQVTREISLLTSQGVIAREGHCLVVRDVALLERMVADVRRMP